MTRRRVLLLALVCVAAIAAGVALAQPFGPGYRRRTPPGVMPEDRAGVPNWKVDEHFKKDVFTFVRIEYDSFGRGGGRRRGYGWARWATDFPDSDLNFSFRLQQLTSLKVNPDPITRRVTDPDLCDYPFLYMIEPGALSFSQQEVEALRRYLLKGGFMMVDDFWGDEEYDNFYREIKTVFPEPQYEPKELPLDHKIFNIVYPLKERPQVPSIHSWLWGDPDVTWEQHHWGNTRDVHYKGIFDDNKRMMVIICHNTDLGDGWEREAENEEYFRRFSEKKSYPMGINIVTYAMTH